MCRKCYFQAAGQNSDIAVEFNDPDEMNNENRKITNFFTNVENSFKNS